MRRSKTLEKLRRDETVLVMNPSLTRSPKFMEILGLLGYDCAWIDTEHREFSTDDLYPSLTAARLHDLDTVVRIRKQDYGDYFRPLELGATGLMVPHVKSPDEARWAVRNAKFAPEGLRGLDAAGPDADFITGGDPAAYCRHANRETFVCVQIEDREALECIDEIAAVPGVDVLFVGPADLSQSLGVPFQFGHDLVRAGFRRVADAAEKHGKTWGTSTGDPEAFEGYVKMGARFLNIGSDLSCLLQAWRDRLSTFRQIADAAAGA